MSIPRQRLALALLLGCLLMPAVSRAQIVNGSFEPAVPFSGNLILGGGSTAIPGWTTTDTGVEWFTPGTYGFGAAPSGIAVVDLANYVYSAGGIQQTFATVPGRVYGFDFKFSTSQSSGRDGTGEIVVSADGQSQVFTIVNHTGPLVWENRTFLFTADDASATLSFRCLQNANVHFAIIDGVGPNATTPTRGSTWGRLKNLYAR